MTTSNGQIILPNPVIELIGQYKAAKPASNTKMNLEIRLKAIRDAVDRALQFKDKSVW